MKWLHWIRNWRIARLKRYADDFKDRSRRAISRGSMSMGIEYSMAADEITQKIEKLKGQP